MQKRIKNHWMIITAGIVGFGVFLLLLGGLVSGLFALEAGNCKGDSNDMSPNGDVTSSANLNDNAKKIFDYFVKNLGFSGAGAAGVVGNASIESGYDPKANGGSVKGIFQWGAGGINGDRLHQGGFIKSDADLTLENELKLAAYELAHSYASVKSKVGHATDPSEASKIWQDEYEQAPGQKTAERQAVAREAYQKFGGSTISANDSLLGNVVAAGDAGANSDAASGQACPNGSEGEGSGEMLDIAKKLLGYFSYAYARPVLQNTMSNTSSHSVSDVRHDGQTDCSGFVWLVCYLAGYKVPAGGWYTGSMYQDATGPHQYLKQVDESSAKAGDIVVCGGPGSTGAGGHTAILAENWHGMSTKVINEGGGGDDVNEHTFEYAFGTALGNDQRIFCEPVAKN
ncbi:phage tail tip lysozyme [Limosilactobacillus fastidiosus]|uniref:CHAP domain-containing protein n=1 Tax=Limosilactobacillus fastidiosus TaxID=2759855 RepID=A0A7W3TXW3_9LACO|nr:phage tail tip lysozyme [Limosilactobacillus fastidiosus]MBB1062390.1 hypothetical protein [Limosilactobacillus fastidiosus]MBB1085296.1 hypothetical protein [Limosilactobacillus fastidiosus]MCD7083465.1 phage tail tip lysozyme [Limosilactobacillus fastidiosus]MCD7085280.1 phage tail tip lysozyme [Limosilactobacillus fastidiosus]MCD7115223.1 phage tail tip lysozyme [Limosilactobacillus fastidiosus]